MILDTLVHSFACSTSILLLSLHLSRVRAQPLPSSFIGSTRLRLLDRWSKVIFRPKHDASPGPGSQSVTGGKIILRPPQNDHSRHPPQLPLVSNSKCRTPPLLHHITTSPSFSMVSRLVTLHHYHTVIPQGTALLCSSRLFHFANEHPSTRQILKIQS